MEKGEVKIAVIGDPGVGKTSLITAAATETFPDHPPPVLPPTRLSADSTPEGVPILITDTLSRPEDRPALEAACTQADVIVLAFDTGQPTTLQRVRTYWLPELRRLNVRVPIILVGCKNDIKPAEERAALQDAVVPVMKDCKEIETCLECSAEKLVFVGEVFYYALKAVVHPTGPLFDATAQGGQGALTPLCVKALKRIFLMCDLDRDGALSDAELNAFQVRCFAAPLQPEELAGVKRVVADKMKEGEMRGVTAAGLTLPGFLFLHALFIERGRLETTWAVLRKFGYDNTLHLSDAVLAAADIPRSPDQVVELTEAARAFLVATFQRADRDSDGALSPGDCDELFSPAPSAPWRRALAGGPLVEERPGGLLPLRSWLALWAALAAASPRKCLEHLLLLGYAGEPAALLAPSRPRRVERGMPTGPARGVFQVLVFGAGGAGKSELLQALAGSRLAPGAAAAGEGLTALAQVERERDRSLATLVIRELDGAGSKHLLAAPSPADALAPYDLAVFVFDSGVLGSLKAAAAQLARVASASGDVLPTLLLAAKDDLGMAPEVEAEAAAVCAALGLPLPLSVARREAPGKRLAGALLAALEQPERELPIPLTPSLKAARQYRRMLRRALLYTAAGTAGALAFYGLLRLARHWRAQREAAAGGAWERQPGAEPGARRPVGLAELASPDTVVAGEQPLWRR
ncbi:hypothetical protein WJX81_001431 [Elliptochloris bilobata]|uniref:Mitochondrial Rho GTPase n=1 Tax=Elliptochloris bilobata TaxID=381761 RepID=A0AAW1SL52_9CHLO